MIVRVPRGCGRKTLMLFVLSMEVLNALILQADDREELFSPVGGHSAFFTMLDAKQRRKKRGLQDWNCVIRRRKLLIVCFVHCVYTR